MAVLQVTARKFREHQKDYFELADKGEKIILKRGSLPGKVSAASGVTVRWDCPSSCWRAGQ